MGYKFTLPSFDGPLDLLLHLIKQSDINICDISIVEITKQYLEYIEKMEEMNLDIASEYLVMAAELMEMKARTLLPQEEENEEEDPREELIQRLLEYKYYKESTKAFKELENYRKEVYTKEPSNLLEYKDKETIDYGVSLYDLLEAFQNFLNSKQFQKPLNTKIASKEYSVGKRCLQIRDILKQKKQISFEDLFDIPTKEYVVVTFLAILNMSKKQEISIEQSKNFDNILIKEKRNEEWKQ